MATKLNFIWISLVLAVIMSCHKLCVPRSFSFSGGLANVLPNRDSIRIGDTIFFNCSIPLNFKYWAGGSDSANYTLSGAKNVETDIHLTSPLGVNEQTAAADSFLFLPRKGSITTNPLAPHAAKTISFIEESDNYTFSTQMVALKKGVYYLAIVDIYQAMKNCDRVSVAITMNNKDGHLHYLKDIYYGGGMIDQIDSTHSYCFKVY